MSKVTVMNHPLIQHKIGIMRMKNTSTKEFRDLVSEVAMLICYEATRELPLEDIEIETPLVKKLRVKNYVSFQFFALDFIWQTEF